MNFRLALASLVAVGSCGTAAAFTPKAFVTPSQRLVVPDAEQLWRPSSSSATNMVAGGAERGMQDEYYDGELLVVVVTSVW